MYVIVTGNSMEPFLHNGDLAILRKSQGYQVGDVVLYHHPKLGPVIHRVIAAHREGYSLQGDNNHWEDSYEPAVSEIAGELWVTLPGAGKVTRVLRTPIGIAMLVGVIGPIVIWPEIKQDDQQ